MGQTARSVVDDVETLDTRLIFGAFGESEGAVYGFAFETIDNLDDVGLFQAYVGADFGGLDVTVGRFQRNFSVRTGNIGLRLHLQIDKLHRVW